MNDNHHSDTKALNYHSSTMLEKLTDASSKIDNQEEKLTDISSKLSTYEDRLGKRNITKTYIKPLSLHITEISPKLSVYEKPPWKTEHRQHH